MRKPLVITIFLSIIIIISFYFILSSREASYALQDIASTDSLLPVEVIDATHSSPSVYQPSKTDTPLSDSTPQTPTVLSTPPQSEISIALTVYDYSSDHLKKLMHILQHAAQRWKRVPVFILTDRPKYIKQLMTVNDVDTARFNIVAHFPDVETSMGTAMAKGESLAYLVKNRGTLSLKTRYVLYIDHTSLPYFKIDSLPVFLGAIAKECGFERDVVLWRNSQSGIKTKLSSKIFLLDTNGAALDFLRLFHNFMDTYSFHWHSDPELALDFTFVAEGYPETLEKDALSTKKGALTYCTIDNAPHLLSLWAEPLPEIKEITFDAASEEKKPAYKGLTDLEGRPVDYLIAIKVVACTARQAVEGINYHMSPRRIVYMVVFADSCRTLLSFGENVRCIWENHVIPGFSKKVIQDLSTRDMVQKRAGWYLLQIMNLYAANLAGLSEHYIVWDADGVPIVNMKLFDKSDNKVVFYAGDEHDWATSVGYHRSYTDLTGNPAIDPPDEGKSPEEVEKGRPTWVAHFMVFKKEYVKAFMKKIEEHRKCGEGKWMYEIIKVINTHTHRWLQRVGFGEYDAYGSFVKLNYPDYFKIDLNSHRTCARLTRAPAGYEDDCCIPKVEVDRQRAAGRHYIVREYGSNCDKTDDN